MGNGKGLSRVSRSTDSRIRVTGSSRVSSCVSRVLRSGLRPAVVYAVPPLPTRPGLPLLLMPVVPASALVLRLLLLAVHARLFPFQLPPLSPFSAPLPSPAAVLNTVAVSICRCLLLPPSL